MRGCSLGQTKPICCRGSIHFFHIGQPLRPELKRANTEELFNDIEIPLLHVLRTWNRKVNLDKGIFEFARQDLGQTTLKTWNQDFTGARARIQYCSPQHWVKFFRQI